VKLFISIELIFEEMLKDQLPARELIAVRYWVTVSEVFLVGDLDVLLRLGNIRIKTYNSKGQSREVNYKSGFSVRLHQDALRVKRTLGVLVVCI